MLARASMRTTPRCWRRSTPAAAPSATPRPRCSAAPAGAAPSGPEGGQDAGAGPGRRKYISIQRPRMTPDPSANAPPAAPAPAPAAPRPATPAAPPAAARKAAPPAAAAPPPPSPAAPPAAARKAAPPAAAPPAPPAARRKHIGAGTRGGAGPPSPAELQALDAQLAAAGMQPEARSCVLKTNHSILKRPDDVLYQWHALRAELGDAVANRVMSSAGTVTLMIDYKGDTLLSNLRGLAAELQLSPAQLRDLIMQAPRAMLISSNDIPQRVLRFCVLLGLDRAATVAWMVEHPDAMRYCGEKVDPEDKLAGVQDAFGLDRAGAQEFIGRTGLLGRAMPTLKANMEMMAKLLGVSMAEMQAAAVANPRLVSSNAEAMAKRLQALQVYCRRSMLWTSEWNDADIGGKCRLLSTGEARVKRLDKVLRAGLSEELRMGSIIRWTDSEFDNIMARKGKL